MAFGIDVSEFQGTPDYGKVAAAGIKFVIGRVNYGATRPDRQYLNWNKHAIPDHGLKAGAYSFLVAGQDAKAQCDAFVNAADPDAAHFLDVEWRGSVDVAGWIQRYHEHFPAREIGIYTGRDLWNLSTGGIDGNGFGPLWVAGYKPNQYVSGGGSLQGLFAAVGSNRGGVPFGGWSNSLIMQFTDNATVPGIAGPVDGDWLFDDSWWGGSEVVTQDDVKAIADGVVARLAGWNPDGSTASFQEMADRTYESAGRIEAAVNAVAVMVQGLVQAESVTDADVKTIQGIVANSVSDTIGKWFGDHPMTAGVDVQAFTTSLMNDIARRFQQTNVTGS